MITSTLSAQSNDTLLAYGAMAVVAVLCFMMLRTTRRKLSERGASPREFAREQVARLKDQHHMKGDMEELLVELQELSRNINAQIDTKFAKLEASIRSADERIARMEQLQAALPERETFDTLLTDDQLLDRPAAAPAAPAPRVAIDPRRRTIFDLADAGKSPLEIAQQTGEPTGEVELILSLRKSAGTSS